MADTVDMKEEGEIESDEENDEIYTKLNRPQAEVNVIKNVALQNYNSDSSPSSDSDGEKPNKFMKRLEKPPQATVTSASLSKNGSLWKNMLQEETLMETLKTCDVSSRKRKFERGAESYDFENLRKHNDEHGGVKFFKRRKMDISENSESSSSNASSSHFKPGKKNRRDKRRRKPKILPDLSVTLESSDEDYARDMAQKLEEDKADLIIRVVSVIGKEASLNLFKITQKIERDGGMLTMNKIRRRTPGGLFLFLLKTSNKIDDHLKEQVFESDIKSVEKGIAERKMSSEQSEAKDPPNSPANPELTEVNGKITDPEIVSQKILNFSKPPHQDVLDLDYDDMDTF